MERAMPIFRWGFIGPGRAGAVQVGPAYRFYRIVPTEVMMASADPTRTLTAENSICAR